MPTVISVIVEFLKLVALEIVAIARRRDSDRKLTAKRKKEEAAHRKLVEEAQDVYQNSLIQLKKKSKIPENPYDSQG